MHSSAAFEQKGAVAQWLEQGTHNPLVVGSSPTGPTFLIRSGVRTLVLINVR